MTELIQPETHTTKYVLGFAFTPHQGSVLLIRKSRPAWQAEKVNGVGGKIEAAESAYDAMCREFKEETNIDTTPGNWHLAGRMIDANFSLYVFGAMLTEEQCQQVKKTTDEMPLWFPMENLGQLLDPLVGVHGTLLHLVTAQHNLTREYQSVTTETPRRFV